MRYSRLGYWGGQAGALAIVALAVVVVVWVLPPQLAFLKFAVLATAMVVAVIIAVWCYRSADEVILLTHKTCWFWGSIIGTVITTVATLAILVRLIALPKFLDLPACQPEVAFTYGAIFVVLIQACGFIVLWTIHNLPRHG